MITGLNDQGEAVWSVNTEEYASTELERTTGIGLRDDVYYYVEGGTLTALKLEDGAVLWKNSEFGGAGAASAFGEDGEIYLCGYYGPDFFAVDEEGNTLCRIDTFDADYYWAHQIQCESGQAVVSMAGSPSGEEVQIIVDLSDFSYRLPDNAGNSGVSAGQAMSLEQICRAVEAHYNSENNTDEYVVFESECMETEDGYILTNYHVVEGGRDCGITLDNNRSYEAKYVAGDMENDLAILKVDLTGLTPAVFGGLRCPDSGR